MIWPAGLANGSDWVASATNGHVMDWIEVWPQRGYKKITEENKEIGLNDFYFYEGQKFGTLQSASAMAKLASMDMLMNEPGWQAEAVRRARLRRCSRSTTASSTASWYSTT